MRWVVDEDYYDLTPPDLVQRVGGDDARTPITRLPWTGVGAQRCAAAAAILSDATGTDADRAVAAAFAGDLLSFRGHPHRLQIAVREVCAWRAEREPEVTAKTASAPPFSLPALLAERDRELSLGPRPTWLEMYRTIHGPPAATALRKST